MNYVKFIIFLILLWRIIHWFPVPLPRFKLRSSSLEIYYGAPGSGKSTFAAWLAQYALRSHIPVYSNVPILGCMQVDKEDIGNYSITDGLLIIDEVGIEYNNRETGNFTKKSGMQGALEFYKKHRHENVQIVIFSQGFDDMDKKLRTLATRMYLIRKSLIPGLIVRKTIRKKPGIDDITHKPVDMYDFVPFSGKRILGKSVYHLFDSFDRMNLPIKLFHIYGEDDFEYVDEYNNSLQGFQGR